MKILKISYPFSGRAGFEPRSFHGASNNGITFFCDCVWCVCERETGRNRFETFVIS